ncbi:MAG: PqqD family protein [Actinomycetota bacterium]|nr:PqqD family protein [Actinomycetota bacterium]
MTNLRLRSDVTWREADDEILAVDGDFKHYASTNATGSVLWRALVAGASRDDLVTRLVDEFGIETSRAAQDVDAFVGELEANGYLET